MLVFHLERKLEKPYNNLQRKNCLWENMQQFMAIILRSLRSKMHPLQAEAGQKGEEKRRKKLKVKIIIITII